MAFELENFENTLWQNILGDIYVSAIGDDNGDGSPAMPYRTIQFAINQSMASEVIVVGTGEYSEEVDGLGKPISIIGDGNVELKGESLLNNGFTGFDGTTSVLDNIKVSGFLINAIDTEFKQVKGCRIEGAVSNFAGSMLKSVIKGSVLTTSGETEFIKCTLLNVTTGTPVQITKLSNTLINQTCVMEVTPAVLADFDYCNQELGSVIIVDTISYNDHSSVNTAFANYQINGKSEVIVFLNEGKGIYALENSSILNSSGEFDSAIGAIERSISYSFGSTSQNYTLSNLQVNALEEGLELSGNAESGFFETAIIDLSSVKKIGKLNLLGKNLFEMLPSNVSVNTDFAFYQPRSLSYEMKFGSTLNEFNTSSYKSFLFDVVPTVDNLGASNADLDFDRAKSTSISSRFIQIKFHLGTTDFFLVQEDQDCILQENGDNILWKIN